MKAARGNLRGGTAERTTRAEGQDAALLNAMSAQSEASRRAEANAAQQYIDMLARLAEAHGERIQQALAYGQMFNWDPRDTVALAQHCIRDVRCVTILDQALKANASAQRSSALVVRRRVRYGTAMVRMTKARRDIEHANTQKMPSLWRPLSRRQWAERRRDERARWAHAWLREQRSEALVTEHALARYVQHERKALVLAARLERQRRARYPVPSDVARKEKRDRSNLLSAIRDPRRRAYGLRHRAGCQRAIRS